MWWFIVYSDLSLQGDFLAWMVGLTYRDVQRIHGEVETYCSANFIATVHGRLGIPQMVVIVRGSTPKSTWRIHVFRSYIVIGLGVLVVFHWNFPQQMREIMLALERNIQCPLKFRELKKDTHFPNYHFWYPCFALPVCMFTFCLE